MAEYYALQAALCFSIAHIFVRRGLVQSNALTGSMTIIWAGFFLKQIEKLTSRVVVGALVTVRGTILVVTAK
jgi:uncharacterized membrane protein